MAAHRVDASLSLGRRRSGLPAGPSGQPGSRGAGVRQGAGFRTGGRRDQPPDRWGGSAGRALPRAGAGNPGRRLQRSRPLVVAPLAQRHEPCIPGQARIHGRGERARRIFPGRSEALRQRLREHRVRGLYGAQGRPVERPRGAPGRGGPRGCRHPVYGNPSRLCRPRQGLERGALAGGATFRVPAEKADALGG